jgi:hypothetical protein
MRGANLQGFPHDARDVRRASAFMVEAWLSNRG